MSNVPTELKYSKEHEWVRIDGNKAVIGITDFAQSELGDIVFVELPQIGLSVSMDQTFGTVESVKTVSDLFAPVSGTVLEVNENLNDTPEDVNHSPYEKGWMIVLEMTDTSELEKLLNADAYSELVAE